MILLLVAAAPLLLSLVAACCLLLSLVEVASWFFVSGSIDVVMIAGSGFLLFLSVVAVSCFCQWWLVFVGGSMVVVSGGSDS